MTESISKPLTVLRASALYIGAILGPGLLLIPGLAAEIAGPASLVSLGALLVLSALLAALFAALGVRIPAADGARSYVAAGLGEQMGGATVWCFLTAVLVGAPTISFIGAGYIAQLLGGGTLLAAGIAMAIVVAVLLITLAGVRSSTTVQLALVALIVVIVALAVLGSAHTARAQNWTPFAPGGIASIGQAAAVLMFSFFGWEAAAPLIARFERPRRQLPWTILIAFVATALVTVSLLVVTIGVLGRHSGRVPLIELIEIAIGPVGVVVGAVVAAVLTLGTLNTYLAGASEMLRSALPSASRIAPRLLLLAIGVSSTVVLTLLALGVIAPAELVAIPTALFLAIYLGSALSATRIFRGPRRAVAVLSIGAMLPVLASCGWALAIPCLVVGLVLGTTVLAGRRAPRPESAREQRLPVPGYR